MSVTLGIALAISFRFLSSGHSERRFQLLNDVVLALELLMTVTV
jgi:hypothetical protein